MSPLEERLSQQFYEWELRGRGWQLWDRPVNPEPSWRPFLGHYLSPRTKPDDGRKPTFLSSLLAKVADRLSDQKETPLPVEEDEEEPEPKSSDRGNLVEFLVSLPPSSSISKEVFEQFILSLARCSEPVAFELIGTHERIAVQLVASESDFDLVRHQLEAHFPEAVCIKQPQYLVESWNAAEGDESFIFEFGLAEEFMLQLATVRNFNIDPLIGLTAAMASLQENEVAVFQVLFEPVNHPWSESIVRAVTDSSGKEFFVNRPELAGEARKKVSRPLFAAVVRVAVKSDGRMFDIANDIAGALTVFSAPGGNEFLPLENSEYNFIDHEEDLLRRESRRSGMILNLDELVSLVHLPSASVRAPKLRREVLRAKAAPALALNKAGLTLGTNSYAGVTNEVRLIPDQRVRHTYIIGTSGTGKSTLLFNLIKQDIENGQGVGVFDCHGDLIDRVLGSIPENRIEDVVLVDPSDEEYSVGFNILSAHSDLEKNLLASDLVSVFQRLSTSWGDQMGSVLNNAILAFLESSKGGTLGDLQRFLIEPDFRNEFLKSVSDTQVLYYWKKAFPQLTGNKSIGPVLTRLGSFLDRKPIRYMVTQKENRLDFADIMNTGKIFLAKLPQGQIGEENAYLLGSFLVSKFQQLAMSRQAQAASSRRDFWCYCDEFHNFITPSMAQILNGAGKYRLGLILAHQELRQLQRDSEVASAVLANPYTRICFRVGDDDARKLGDGFSYFESKDLQNLPNYQAICRVERADGDFNLAIPSPIDPGEAQAAEIRQRVIDSSRRKYAVPRKQVEAEQASAFVDFDSVVAEPRPRKAAKPPVETPLREPAPQPVEEPPKPAPPPVTEPPPAPAPVIPREEPGAKVEIVPKPAPVPADLGRGGAQHKAIQHRLKSEAEKLGFGVTVEKQILNGQGSIDLLLERGEIAIACEISFTTTIDHEVGNVLKCLKGGYQNICVVCTESGRLSKIQSAVSKCISAEEASLIRYLEPEELLTQLREHSLKEPLPPPPPETKIILGKYKVKTKHAVLDDEEHKQKEEEARKIFAARINAAKRQKK